jgi:acyl-coenzyme A synthetase/AMP-(fatty) acid ligase
VAGAETTASPEAEVASWLELYGGPELQLGEILCDAHAHADAVALIYEGPRRARRLTFAELRDQSSRLGGALRELGVTRATAWR